MSLATLLVQITCYVTEAHQYSLAVQLVVSFGSDSSARLDELFIVDVSFP